MKHLIQLTTAIALLISTMGYAQTELAQANSEKLETTTQITTDPMASFIGTFYLAEGDFNLEIVEEDKKFYIVSPFSKDILVPKSLTKLHEPTRGVDLELIDNDKSALKFTQNGYETTIKRVEVTTEK